MKRLMALLVLLNVIAICAGFWSVERSNELVGRVQACEICHFGGDAETIVGQIKALRSEVNGQRQWIENVSDMHGATHNRVTEIEQFIKTGKTTPTGYRALDKAESDALAANILRHIQASSDMTPDEHLALVADIVFNTVNSEPGSRLRTK